MVKLSNFVKQCTVLQKLIQDIDDIVVYDGVINPELYYNSTPKILWILKESNSAENVSWSYVDCFKSSDWLLKCNNLASIRRVIYISYAILNKVYNWSDLPWSNDKRCHESLQKIAYININKRQGKSTADDYIISKAAKDNKDIISKQIATYNPDIIVMGNTLKYFDEHISYFGEELGEKNVSSFKNHYYKTKKRLYINAYHPSALGKGFSDKNYVMDIVNICKDCLTVE